MTMQPVLVKGEVDNIKRRLGSTSAYTERTLSKEDVRSMFESCEKILKHIRS